MSTPISCRTCGATDAAQLSATAAHCKYCGVVLYQRPLAPFNPFSRIGAVGNNTKSYVVSGIALMAGLSLLAAYLDGPRWFSSDFAIALWSAIIPLLTLAWAFNLHPQRRTVPVIIAVIDANVLPFLIATAIRVPRALNSDDLWGIAGLFAACSAAGFVIGAIVNNFRKAGS